MKTLRTFLLTLSIVAPAFAQERTYPPASQAEVSAGVVRNKFLSPFTARGAGLLFSSNSLTEVSNLTFTVDGSQFVLTGCADTNVNGIYGVSNAGPNGLIFTNTSSPTYYVVSNLFHAGPTRAWVVTNDTLGAIARSGNTPGGALPQDGVQWLSMAATGTNPPTAYFHYNSTFTNPAATYLPYEYVLIDRFGNDLTGSRGPLSPFATMDNAFYYSRTNFSISGVLSSNQFPYNYVLDPGTYPSVVAFMPPGSKIVGSGLESYINGILPFNASNYVGYLKISVLEGNTINAISNTVVENVEIGATNGIDCLYGPNLNIYNLTVRNAHLMTSWDATEGIIGATFVNVGIDGVGGQQATSTGLHGYNVTHENCNYTIIGGYVNLSGLNTNLLANPFNGSSSTNACLWICGTNATVKLVGPSFIHDTNNLAIYNFVGCTNVSGYFYDNGAYVSVFGTNYFKSGVITNTTPVAGDFYGGKGAITWLSNQTMFISTYNGSAVSTAKVGP